MQCTRQLTCTNHINAYLGASHNQTNFRMGCQASKREIQTFIDISIIEQRCQSGDLTRYLPSPSRLCLLSPTANCTDTRSRGRPSERCSASSNSRSEFSSRSRSVLRFRICHQHILARTRPAVVPLVWAAPSLAHTRNLTVRISTDAVRLL